MTYKNDPFLNRKVKDSFKGQFVFLGYQPCIRRSSSLGNGIEVLKRREQFEVENF